MWQNTTPVPNAVFDTYLGQLKNAELKILLVIIRQTLGWKDKASGTGRKESDWISGSQLRAKTRCSPRAISSATEILIQKKLIEVSDQRGSLLDSPQRRKGKTKLFYALTSANFAIVDNEGKKGEEGCNSRNTYANFAEDFSKKYAALQQKLQITK